MGGISILAAIGFLVVHFRHASAVSHLNAARKALAEHEASVAEGSPDSALVAAFKAKLQLDLEEVVSNSSSLKPQPFKAPTRYTPPINYRDVKLLQRYIAENRKGRDFIYTKPQNSSPLAKLKLYLRRLVFLVGFSASVDPTGGHTAPPIRSRGRSTPHNNP